MRIIIVLLLTKVAACYGTFESDVLTQPRCMAVTTIDTRPDSLTAETVDETVEMIKDALVASTVIDMIMSDNPEEEAAIGLFALLLVSFVENTPRWVSIPIMMLLFYVAFFKKDPYDKSYY